VDGAPAPGASRNAMSRSAMGVSSSVSRGSHQLADDARRTGRLGMVHILYGLALSIC
jgi:hypothetical protein